MEINVHSLERNKRTDKLFSVKMSIVRVLPIKIILALYLTIICYTYFQSFYAI